jgi:hypothetical protein
MKKLIMLFVLFAITLSAADVTGTWKATAKSGSGTIKRTFIFKQDGARFTGKTISDKWGASDIKDGRIEGEDLSFTILVDIEFGRVKISFAGKVQGDIIKMTAELDGGTFDFTAHRSK